MSEIKTLEELDVFLLNAPLYSSFKLDSYSPSMLVLYNRQKHTLDGFCPYCHGPSTFSVKGQHIPAGDPWNGFDERVSFDEAEIVCTRKGHAIKIFFLINKSVLMKVGQYPSLADIANDESKKFKNLLSKNDGNELHKAIGLAAHGVGIGSFVYLRRIFERLIINRFEQYKEEEYWLEEDFYPKRMSEKIELISSHLPDFLTSNTKIYSIMSLAVHELSDEICLSVFPIIKGSIIMILEEDKKLKDDLAMKQELAKSIRDYEAWEAKQISEGKVK